MSEPSETVLVARELASLIPAFLVNRRSELAALRAALAAEDYAGLCQLGHRMKGVGASYGFAPISAYGAQIEDRARAPDRAAVAAQIEAYAEYLGRVRIVYD